MSSVSGPQHRYMAMASTAKGRAKLRAEGKTPPSGKVANEFLNADRGRHFSAKKFKGR